MVGSMSGAAGRRSDVVGLDLAQEAGLGVGVELVPTAGR
jgi:hypothetical protein